MIRYELSLSTDRGVWICPISTALDFSYTYRVNHLGSLTMTLPASFDADLIQRDRLIYIWRHSEGKSLFFPYFITRKRPYTRNDRHYLEVHGVGPNTILDWRIVAYYEASANATGDAIECDDLMKDIFGTNFLTCTLYDTGAADNDREWAEHLSVQGDNTAGPPITKSFDWRNVLAILQELSDESRELGTQVWFEMAVASVTRTDIQLQFRTMTGQPGTDLTGLGVRFAEERGNLRDAYLEYDWSEERTYVYGLGRGETDNRNIQPASDTTRIGESYWGRKEDKASAIMQEEDDDIGVAGEARSRLNEQRPIIRAGGQALDTSAFRLGVDWKPGDKVRVKYRGIEFDAIIPVLNVHVGSDGKEDIQARLEYVE
jgi:hypothetical protein